LTNSGKAEVRYPYPETASDPSDHYSGIALPNALISRSSRERPRPPSLPPPPTLPQQSAWVCAMFPNKIPGQVRRPVCFVTLCDEVA
jgi:hypothetical protein